VYDVASGASERIGDCPEQACKEIDISPDGSLVTYYAESLRNGKDTLVVVEVDSQRSHRIDLPGEAGSPTFSPDGSRILLPLLGGTTGLYVIDVSGIAAEAPEPTLIYGMVEAMNAVWSPDSEWIAFDAAMPDGYKVWVVRADGTETQLPVIGPAFKDPGYPAWSLDSRSVAYLRTSSQRDGGKTLELWTVGLNGGQPSRIYASECCIFDWTAPTWSPDGEYISFGVGVDGRRAVSGTFLIRPDGTDLHRASERLLRPDWQPVPIPSTDE
jgi:Tol biopolymer transport system component